MSKKNRNKKTAAKSAAKQKAGRPTKHAQKKPSLLSRRNALKALIAVPAVAVAGTAIHRYDVQNKDLHQLSVIGQGKPVVVQVHDPSCQLCRQLMKNTRTALKNNPGVVYRVADMTKAEGGAFQRKHHADKVTLVLFDKAGNKVDTLVGVRPSNELEQRFAAL